MKIPAELLYSTDHEWVKVENGKVWVGNDALVMRAEAS